MATRAGVEACGAVVVGGAVDAVVEVAVDPVVTGTDVTVELGRCGGLEC